jgi:hypothetical protein
MGQWVVGYYGFTSIGRWLERIADRAWSVRVAGLLFGTGFVADLYAP